MTIYHGKYYANFLSLKQPNGSADKLGNTLLNATIDLNPHQVQGALFFFKNPLSKGVILADEVGLGKTIEAGLIICQLRSEFKRNILLVVPASLRKQWKTELEEKFFLETIILDSKTYKEYEKTGNKNPFKQNAIIIASYEFVVKKQIDISKIKRNLVVFDEAHKLRNFYKDTTNKTRAGKLYYLFKDTKKVLLTATPFQNSLMELYGLVSYIDEHIFGNIETFKAQFSKLDRYNIDELKRRLLPIVNRTLRKQVKEYIKFTNRISITQNFEPTDIEVTLYEKMNKFLQMNDLVSINTKTKHLVVLVLRKLLASSAYAIEGTLQNIIQRLESKQFSDIFTDEIDIIENYNEVFESDEEKNNIIGDLQKLKKEISQLKEIQQLAKSIKTDTKSMALLKALDIAFEKILKLGGNKKALIFTESIRTQQYLKLFLEENGYKGKIVLFNGSNNDHQAQEIYKEWLKKHQGSSKVSGSKESDIRAALVEYFKDHAYIMIATESASEGVNLQFCSLVINYDLPWNPQRIEQRIGRCHRYGQKIDVLVVNFLNTQNYADKRVYELLSEKFGLFDGIFGASDEILGALDDGTSFEQRILNIYQNCRTKEEIDLEFQKIEEEYKDIIEARKSETKRSVIENFDAEVLKRLKDIEIGSINQLDIYQKYFWYLSKYVLANYAIFDDDNLCFELKENPFDVVINKGKYTLKKTDIDNAYFHRPQSPLGQNIIEYAKNQVTDSGEVEFMYDAANPKITGFRDYIGKYGWLQVDKLTISSFEDEEYLIVTAITQDYELLNPELAKNIFQMPGNYKGNIYIDANITNFLQENAYKIVEDAYKKSIDRNSKVFDEEIAKLDAWEEDQRQSLFKAIDEIKHEIHKKRSESLKTSDNALKMQLRNEAMKLEKKQREMEQDYFKNLKEIENQKREMINDIESKMQSKKTVETLFKIKRHIL